MHTVFYFYEAVRRKALKIKDRQVLSICSSRIVLPRAVIYICDSATTVNAFTQTYADYKAQYRALRQPFNFVATTLHIRMEKHVRGRAHDETRLDALPRRENIRDGKFSSEKGWHRGEKNCGVV